MDFWKEIKKKIYQITVSKVYGGGKGGGVVAHVETHIFQGCRKKRGWDWVGTGKCK